MNPAGQQTVAVVDYGMGNLRSVEHALLAAAADLPVRVIVTEDPQCVRDADRVVLPGQGAMGGCMDQLRHSGLLAPVLEAAETKPLFGVCIGMQMLLAHSDEGADATGTDCLNLFPGTVQRFPLEGRYAPDGSRYKVPHMGWNRVRQRIPHPLWRGVTDDAWFYFVHSYYAHPENAAHSAGETDYGIRFTSVLARDNLFATQFHPEKSARDGLTLYRNFLLWKP